MADSAFRCSLTRGSVVHRAGTPKSVRLCAFGQRTHLRSAGLVDSSRLQTRAGSADDLMSAEQVNRGLEFQLKRVSEAPTSPVRPPEEPPSVSETSGVRDAKGVDNEASQGVQRELIQRTGSLSEEQMLEAIQRQVGATHASWDEADIEANEPESPPEKTEATPADSQEAPSASEPAPDSQNSTLEPTEEYEDGTVTYTAEQLQAVDYDEVSPK